MSFPHTLTSPARHKEGRLPCAFSPSRQTRLQVAILTQHSRRHQHQHRQVLGGVVLENAPAHHQAIPPRTHPGSAAKWTMPCHLDSRFASKPGWGTPAPTATAAISQCLQPARHSKLLGSDTHRSFLHFYHLNRRRGAAAATAAADAHVLPVKRPLPPLQFKELHQCGEHLVVLGRVLS